MSDLVFTMADMHHPWRHLREQFPDWTVRFLPLPAGIMAASSAAIGEIWIDSRSRQVERRCSLDHELTHAEAGDVGCQPPKRERQISALSARRLISVDDLLRVLRWANSPEEAADELWVDVDTFNIRMQCVTPPELIEIRRIFNERQSREGA